MFNKTKKVKTKLDTISPTDIGYKYTERNDGWMDIYDAIDRLVEGNGRTWEETTVYLIKELVTDTTYLLENEQGTQLMVDFLVDGKYPIPRELVTGDEVLDWLQSLVGKEIEIRGTLEPLVYSTTGIISIRDIV